MTGVTGVTNVTGVTCVTCVTGVIGVTGVTSMTGVTSVPVQSAHYQGSVESISQLAISVCEHTTGGQLPARDEPAICSGALVPHKSGLWIGKWGFGTYTTMYNVFYVINHSMIMNTKNGLQM